MPLILLNVITNWYGKCIVQWSDRKAACQSDFLQHVHGERRSRVLYSPFIMLTMRLYTRVI